MIHAYSGTKNKDQVVQSAFATILSQTASTVTVRVTKNGVSKDIAFTNPFNAGAAPHLTTRPLPTRPVTVPSRAANPKTGGYPDWLEATEGAAPPDLNGGKFVIGPGDGSATAALSASSSAAAQLNSIFSAVRIGTPVGVDVHDVLDGARGNVGVAAVTDVL